MKKGILAVVAMLVSLSAMAFEAKVQSKSVGEVTISSESEDWSVDAKIESKGQQEYLTIELKASQAMTPPKFEVAFRTPQLDAHHVWYSGNTDRARIQPDWRKGYHSSLAEDMPLYSFINTNNQNRLTVATGEALRRVEAVMGLREEGAVLQGRLTYFVEPEAPISHYKATILLDKRDIFWADAVREASEI